MDDLDLDLFLDDAIDLGADHASRPLVPRGQRGLSPTVTHGIVLGKLAERIRRWFPRARVSVDKRGTDRQGRVVTPLRPDIQSIRQRGRITRVEVDTRRPASIGHRARMDPRVRNVYLVIDPDDGRILEKHVWDPLRGTMVLARDPELKRGDLFAPSAVVLADRFVA